MYGHVYTRAEYESQSENPKRNKVKCITECSALVTRQSAAVIYLSSQAQGDAQLCRVQASGMQDLIAKQFKSGSCVKTVSQVWLSVGARQCSSQSQGLRVRTATPARLRTGFTSLHFSLLLHFFRRGKSCKRTEALAPSCRDIHFLLSINTQGTIHCPANALGQLLQMVHLFGPVSFSFHGSSGSLAQLL